MKKVLCYTAVVAAFVLSSMSVHAQAPEGSGQGGGQWGHGQRQPMTADQRLAMMTKQLNLTSDQQQQIKPILEKESTQMDALHQDSSLSQQDRMMKMQQIRQDSSSQIKPILNADQQTKYAQMMSHQGGRRGGMPPGGAPGQTAPPQSDPQ